MSNHVTLPHKPTERPVSASEVDKDTSGRTPPPPPAMLLDPDEITLVTDQERRCLFVSIPGYGRITPQQLVACLEAQQALGAARADAAALEVEVGRLARMLADECADHASCQEQLELWERCQNENVFRMLINQRDAARDQAAMVERELATLQARMPVLEAAAGCEGGSR